MPHFVYRNIVCTTLILYSSPNWYAVVKSCRPERSPSSKFATTPLAAETATDLPLCR